MTEDPDARIGALRRHQVARALGTVVIHDIDGLDLGADGGEDVEDVRRDAEAGDYDCYGRIQDV
jgi:hypothetical protein